MKYCDDKCHIDDWCICEAVQLIEKHIEDDLIDLSEENKNKYFKMLNDRIRELKFK